MNQKPRENCSSIYKGAHWNKHANKWRARIWTDGKLIHLGYFDIEEDAARAYNAAAKLAFGEFAKLNAIEMMKSGNTIEFYEQVLKQLEDESKKS